MEQVINDFKSSLDYQNTYTLKDLQKLLEVSYKKFNKTKGSSKSSSDVKKAPSPYNLFIKEEITRMKEEKLEGVEPKDYMKLAAQRWQLHKNKGDDMSVVGGDEQE
jgi:hypothetical protein